MMRSNIFSAFLYFDDNKISYCWKKGGETYCRSLARTKTFQQESRLLLATGFDHLCAHVIKYEALLCVLNWSTLLLTPSPLLSFPFYSSHFSLLSSFLSFSFLCCLFCSRPSVALRHASLNASTNSFPFDVTSLSFTAVCLGVGKQCLLEGCTHAHTRTRTDTVHLFMGDRWRF